MSNFFRYVQPNNTFFLEEVSGSAQILIDEAQSQGIEVEIIDGTRMIVFTKNGKRALISDQTPDKTSYIGFAGSEDKGACRSLLSRANISIPSGFTLRASQPEIDWLKVFHDLQTPLVVKPTHGSHGDKVFMNISSEVEYLDAVKKCFDNPLGDLPGVIVEEQFDGTEYRIVATRDDALAIVCRLPANVIGDGVQTISELIQLKNSDPRRSDKPSAALRKIAIDDALNAKLLQQNLSLDSVPELGLRIFLRSNSNISTGGDSIDVTDIAHPSVKELAIRSVVAIPGLSFAGVDFMTKDITKEQTPETYCIIELNKSPGFDIHEFPFEGEPRPVGKAILALLFS
jgi:D-alanine-D-alanine ligase-like ATP-grasp enzyme